MLTVLMGVSARKLRLHRESRRIVGSYVPCRCRAICAMERIVQLRSELVRVGSSVSFTFPKAIAFSRCCGALPRSKTGKCDGVPLVWCGRYGRDDVQAEERAETTRTFVPRVLSDLDDLSD